MNQTFRKHLTTFLTSRSTNTLKPRTFELPRCHFNKFQQHNNFRFQIVRMAATEGLRADKLFSVKDYVCVVTGGGTGIGLMASQALAANGARVYITSRRGDVLKRSVEEHDSSKISGEIIPITCDVTKKDDLEKLVKEIESKEKHGIDLLVTAAGIDGERASPDESDAQSLKDKLMKEDQDKWTETFNTNVSSVYFTTVAFLPLLQKSMEEGGKFNPSVITISSMSGLISHAQGHFSYNASKAATIHLGKMMAYEFKDAKIRVNSIAPGYFPSEMTTHGESDEQNKSKVPDSKIREKGHVPMGRPGTDEEMAMGIMFLAKNTYVNGEVIAIDGGVMLDLPSR